MSHSLVNDFPQNYGLFIGVLFNQTRLNKEYYYYCDCNLLCMSHRPIFIWLEFQYISSPKIFQILPLIHRSLVIKYLCATSWILTRVNHVCPFSSGEGSAWDSETEQQGGEWVCGWWRTTQRSLHNAVSLLEPSFVVLACQMPEEEKLSA